MLSKRLNVDSRQDEYFIKEAEPSPCPSSLEFGYRVKLLKFLFRKNLSITLVQPSFILIKYREGRSTTLFRFAGLDRGEG